MRAAGCRGHTCVAARQLPCSRCGRGCACHMDIPRTHAVARPHKHTLCSTHLARCRSARQHRSHPASATNTARTRRNAVMATCHTPRVRGPPGDHTPARGSHKRLEYTTCTYGHYVRMRARLEATDSLTDARSNACARGAAAARVGNNWRRSNTCRFIYSSHASPTPSSPPLERGCVPSRLASRRSNLVP